MNTSDRLRMKLATILSTDHFGLHETRNLIELNEIITEQRHVEFYQIISDKMRDELYELLEDDLIEHGYALATVLGHAAVLDWIDGDSQGIVTLILEAPDTYAGQVALESLELCFHIAEYGLDISDFRPQTSSRPPQCFDGKSMEPGAVPEAGPVENVIHLEK